MLSLLSLLSLATPIGCSVQGFTDVVSGIEKVSEQKSAIDEIKVSFEFLHYLWETQRICAARTHPKQHNIEQEEFRPSCFLARPYTALRNPHTHLRTPHTPLHVSPTALRAPHTP